MAYIRCAGDSGGSIQKKTATGAVATFNTGLPAPLIDVTSAIGYRSNGYTSASVINSKTTPVIDKTPYQTRIAPSNIGNMALEKLVGVSVCFNQLVDYSNARGTFTQNDITVTNNNDGSYTINGTANADLEAYLFNTLLPFEKDHVYYSRFCISGGSDSTYRVYLFANNGNNLIDKDFGNGNIIKAGTYTNQNLSPYIEVANGVSVSGTVYYQYIDLTAMFGSEVADYLYTLESGTAGSGVALFKSLFGEYYYPYTANTLMSCKPLSKVIKDSNDQTVATVNFSGNELRGLFKVGTNGLYADGDIDDGSGTGMVRYGIVDLSTLSWSQTALTPDITDAYVTGGLQGLAKYPTNNSTPILAICSDYMIMPVNSIYSNNKSIAMNNGGNLFVRNDGAGVSPTGYLIYELATPTTATSTAWTNPITAKQGGTETFVDGNFYGCVDLGSLNWDYYGGRFNTTEAISDVGGEISGDHYVNAFCDIYENTTSGNDKTFFIYSNKYLYVYNSEYTDATAFKNAMSGTYLFYEISTSTFELPTGHDTIYGTDLVVKTADFGQTVFGGSVDFTTGEVISNKNADGTDKTAETISITPVEVLSNAGTNNVFSDTNGNTTAQYIDKR